ncbi:ACS family hexuronate transporter-like MFS transporter [Chitinophaga skermanii]|uniref:ACS family hexuronate transporter-like MFS transporter n=1 Tax=Chitinophaga skermanii TaxID=331697 RepID=A0A327QNQ4_9BACT|nr:MFS transporter [Chitinophaga skermanii]RAJ05324.1 ACS family hexuronate transporter-like MFS transporter [Chitinophaga skermanii]
MNKTVDTLPPKEVPPVHQAIGKYRYTVVALLFFATTINYLDRQIIGFLKPELTKEFGWTEMDYSKIIMAFQLAYAAGFLVFGKYIEKIGTKVGYILSVTIWSIAAIFHAAAKSTFGFGIARSALGLGEAGNFPAAIKSVAEWFPKRERALATGIFNSGANIGAVAAPLLIPWLLAAYGWQEAFIVTGAVGFVWLACWMIFYQIPAKSKKLGAAEYAYIHSDDQTAPETEEGKVSWGKMLQYRQTWAFVFGKFLTDPIWWFFLLWLPDYFSSAFHLNLKEPGWPLVIIYTSTTIGSIGGGYLSSYLIKKGWSVFKARKVAMLVFAISVVPIIFAKYAGNMWVIVGLISLAAAAHQAWSANIFTTASDMFPKKAVSSIVGIGGMAGAVGGILFPMLVGGILDYFNQLGNKTAGYNLIFILCGSAYLLAWLLMHLLAPKMDRVEV